MDSSGCQCSAKEKEDHNTIATAQLEGLKEHGGLDTGKTQHSWTPEKAP